LETMNYGLRTKKMQRRRWIRTLLFLSVVLFIFSLYSAYFRGDKTTKWNEGDEKQIMLHDSGFDFSFTSVSEKTVGKFLEAKKLSLKEGDSVFPDVDSVLFPGTHILMRRAHSLEVSIDGKTVSLHTQALTVGEALSESDFHLDTDDIVKPARDTFAESGIKVLVTRVKIEEITVEKPIAFDTKVNEDETLSWRKTLVTQKGENGIKSLRYKVSSYDGKEVNRKLIGTEVTKEPVPQITTQGTSVKLGKSHTGGSSWYAYTGTMSAANPWLPKGSFVKVTNIANGKSVIVKINDRGPFVPGRIIDLDKVAFAKIASIGAGVITVKMEEITN